eukprot:1196074-Prorocentrum_minimum.AAC.1
MGYCVDATVWGTHGQHGHGVVGRVSVCIGGGVVFVNDKHAPPETEQNDDEEHQKLQHVQEHVGQHQLQRACDIIITPPSGTSAGA